MHKIDVLNNLPEHLEKQCINHWKKICREEGVCIRFEKMEVQKSITYHIFDMILAIFMAAVIVFIVGIITSLMDFM